jgi:short-subunit dehydrogenase
MVSTRPVAAITGASAGIGAEFARQLAARGYDLILIARRTDRLHQLAAELNTSSEIVTADLARPADVDSLAARLATESRLTLLVNNAGFGTLGRFFEADPTGQVDMHMVHVVANVKLIGAVLPALMSRNGGGIINVASVAGFMMSTGNVSYCATKRWMNAFTEGLYLELRTVGSAVKVQALCPGYTYSEFHETMGVDRGSIPHWAWLKAPDVVAESLRGLERGRLFVIPNWKYRLAVGLLALIPASLQRALAGGAGEKYRAQHRGHVNN